MSSPTIDDSHFPGFGEISPLTIMYHNNLDLDGHCNDPKPRTYRNKVGLLVSA